MNLEARNGRAQAVAVLLCLLAVALAVLPATAGCGSAPGKPTLISFTGKDSESAEKMKPIIEDLKKEYEGRVIFEDVDMDDPANKDKVEEYYVTMNPTFIVLNPEGEVKETFMGAAQEEMLTRAINAFLPAGEDGDSEEGFAPPSEDSQMPSPVPGLPEGVPPLPVEPDTQ